MSREADLSSNVPIWHNTFMVPSVSRATWLDGYFAMCYMMTKYHAIQLDDGAVKVIDVMGNSQNRTFEGRQCIGEQIMQHIIAFSSKAIM